MSANTNTPAGAAYGLFSGFRVRQARAAWCVQPRLSFYGSYAIDYVGCYDPSTGGIDERGLWRSYPVAKDVEDRFWFIEAGVISPLFMALGTEADILGLSLSSF